jgi:hypothetical protein
MASTLEEILKKQQQAQQANQSEAVTKLDPAEKKRLLKRLKELFVRLKSGEDISRRDLQNALTEEHWEEFEYNNQNVDVEKTDSSNRPDELRTYTGTLRISVQSSYKSVETRCITLCGTLKKAVV